MGKKQTGDNEHWKITKYVPGVKPHLQTRSCCKKAQCGPVKPACRITTSFQSACYNLPVACPAPAPRFQSHMACVSLGTHFFHPASGPTGKQVRNNLSPLPILAMFPLFLPCLLKLDGMEKTAHLFLELKRLGNKGLPERNWMSLRRVKWFTDDSPRKKCWTEQTPCMWSWRVLGSL